MGAGVSKKKRDTHVAWPSATLGGGADVDVESPFQQHPGAAQEAEEEEEEEEGEESSTGIQIRKQQSCPCSASTSSLSPVRPTYSEDIPRPSAPWGAATNPLPVDRLSHEESSAAVAGALKSALKKRERLLARHRLRQGEALSL